MVLVGCAFLTGVSAPRARAAEGPLLVVVEAPPELSVDAGEIRRAIGTELHDPTVAPARLVSETSERALIVSVERERITMSLRESTTTPVIRSIPAPADPTARLRAIAWLGGNLARDQVSGIVAEPVPPPPPPVTEPPPVPTASVPAPVPPPAASPPPASVERPVATVTATTEPRPAPPSAWTIGVAAGPAVSLYEAVHVFKQSLFGSWNLSTTFPNIYRGAPMSWRIEARHRSGASGVTLGLALEGLSSDPAYPVNELMGAMGLAASCLHWRRFTFEALLGAGLDVGNRLVGTFSRSSDGTTTVTESTALRPGLFAAGNVAVAHPLLDVVDWAVSIDAHVSVVDEYDSYLAATLGLRYRF